MQVFPCRCGRSNFEQVLDMMLVWSRSLDTAVALCKKPGGMTEIAIKHFQASRTPLS